MEQKPSDRAIFLREYMGEWVVDPLFETYLNSWLIYHRVANEIDGHVKHPQSISDIKLMNKARIKAQRHQAYYLADNQIYSFPRGEKWRDANQEAQRLLGDDRGTQIERSRSAEIESTTRRRLGSKSQI